MINVPINLSIHVYLNQCIWLTVSPTSNTDFGKPKFKNERSITYRINEYAMHENMIKWSQIHRFDNNCGLNNK